MPPSKNKNVKKMKKEQRSHKNSNFNKNLKRPAPDDFCANPKPAKRSKHESNNNSNNQNTESTHQVSNNVVRMTKRQWIDTIIDTLKNADLI